MKTTVLSFLTRLYPAVWRRRYEAEFDALLDELQPSWRDVFDVLKGALKMQFAKSLTLKFAIAFSVLGAIVAGIIAVALPDRYVATGIMTVQYHDSAAKSNTTLQLAESVFSRPALTQVIEKHDLYRSERANQPLENVVDQMRRDIRVQLTPLNTIEVSFVHNDRHKAQVVTEEILDRFVKENLLRKVNSTLQVIDTPSLPQSPISPNRTTIALIGLCGGSLLGVAIASIRRVTH
jgi:capsular polysaccharide biosynthesis protein